ncbi:ribonuclease T2 [Coralliovum pocilloporae]|uniref:ribonuclease T2 n=1 Tax=Coralliovum pocilloporae TaxID=3066369 RepID=UPI00330739DC
MRSLWISWLALALWFSAGNAHAADRSSRGVPGEFDYYVLALSWSPSYCDAAGDRANRLQCSSGRRFSFVVHGLWPQYERGWPQYCDRDAGRLTRSQVDSVLDIVPSPGLVRHEWQKHGTCSGLSGDGYLEHLRKAYDKVRIPEAFARIDRYLTVDPIKVEKSFLKINADLPGDGIAVTCDRRRLREVRICFTRDLEFRPCHAVDTRACRKRRVVMPPVR